MDIPVVVVALVALFALIIAFYYISRWIFGRTIFRDFLPALIPIMFGLVLIIVSIDLLLSDQYEGGGLLAFIGVIILFWGVSLVRKAWKS